jgi:hypothetical protein
MTAKGTGWNEAKIQANNQKSREFSVRTISVGNTESNKCDS